MTKSAKPVTEKDSTAKTQAHPAETVPAEPDSAPADVQEASAPDAAVPDDTVPDDTVPDAADPEAAAAKPDLDETKRKFREALERKHAVHSDSQGNGGRDGSKVNNAHGPAASRRNFRRKSG